MVKFYLFCVLVSMLFRITRSIATYNYTGLNISGTDTFPYSEETDVGNLPQIAWLTKLFDHHAWNNEYLQNSGHVCQQDIVTYLTKLKQDNSWATKMNDASGRYNGQFFFGNDFWLGSSTLCTELGNADTNSEVPPFRVHFNVAKVQLTIADQAPEYNNRQIMVGQCLPSSCSEEDLANILAFDAMHANSKSDNASVEVLEIRRVPGSYSLLKDTKFYIVGGVGVAVAIIVAIATMYELYIITTASKYTDHEVEASTNNNNDVKRIDTVGNKNEKDGKTIGTKKKYLNGLPSEILLCFSALSNGRKILDMDTLPEDSIKCVHGLRFLSVSWVILVHTYLEVFSIGENKTLRVITERFFFYQSISNATFSVDSFFFISGLLVTILYFRTTKSKETGEDQVNVLPSIRISIQRFLLLIFYRLTRLTPAYLFVLGIHELAIRYLHNFSVFEPNLYDHETCDKYWWRNALYINTWYPQKEICMLWSWYMSNDTQFYIMAIIILLIAVKSSIHLKVAASILAVFLVSSWITTFLMAYHYEYHVRVEEPFALFDQLYDKPWMRVGPYLVGMATGWLLHATNLRCNLPRIITSISWLVAVGCLGALVYGVGRDGLRIPLSAAYAGFGHTAWGLALGWITFACCTGYGGPVNAILSFRGFLPFSRLTYCAYLVHPMIMCITSFQMDGPIHLHNGIILVIYFGNVVVAFLLSFVISLGFEAPIVRLLKILIGGRNKED